VAAVAQQNPSNHVVEALALGLVALTVVRYYAPWLAPADVRGLVSKSLGAAQSLVHIVALCILVLHRLRRVAGPIMLAAAYAAWEDAQGAICPIWYIFEPWHVPQGAAMCSARAGYDFGVLGAFVAVGVVCLIYRWGARQ
jgi:hypothetical protein